MLPVLEYSDKAYLAKKKRRGRIATLWRDYRKPALISLALFLLVLAAAAIAVLVGTPDQQRTWQEPVPPIRPLR